MTILCRPATVNVSVVEPDGAAVLQPPLPLPLPLALRPGTDDVEVTEVGSDVVEAACPRLHAPRPAAATAITSHRATVGRAPRPGWGRGAIPAPALSRCTGVGE